MLTWIQGIPNLNYLFMSCSSQFLWHYIFSNLWFWAVIWIAKMKWKYYSDSVLFWRSQEKVSLSFCTLTCTGWLLAAQHCSARGLHLMQFSGVEYGVVGSMGCKVISKCALVVESKEQRGKMQIKQVLTFQFLLT